ncbi:MAG: hypothetical protein KGZ40_04570 [Clostridiales bacterium]|nr:hypothetical protein [Clostridiales bacterium]
MDHCFTYRDAVSALGNALTFGVNPSLTAITAMTEVLGWPHRKFDAVQVTGTNGKSSTARFIEALLRFHGLRTGLYTSPELHSYTERIEVDGTPVDEEMFARGVKVALDAARRAGVEPTEFEILTAAALWTYRECAVEVAVLEVGMGGRWDATSVVEPKVAVVTGVALDHTEYLGETRGEIASDKAHIIKARSMAILGPGTRGVERTFQRRLAAVGDAALLRAVRSKHAESPVAEDETIRYAVTRNPDAPDAATIVDVWGVEAAYGNLALRGPSYQGANLATAIAAGEAYLGRALDSAIVGRVASETRIPGRFEVVRREPWLVVDTAHNAEGAEVLAAAIALAWPDCEARPAVVLGVLADKDAEGIVSALARVCGRFVAVAPGSPRALPAAELANTIVRVTGKTPQVAHSVSAGVVSALAANSAGAVVTGSVRTAAEAIVSG